MNSDLTVFLIRTSPRISNGLHLRVKYRTLRKNLVLFEETTHPACTILHSGLFLMAPSHPDSTNPVVVCVLNQPELSSEPYPSVNNLGVSWSSKRSPVVDESQVSAIHDSEMFLGKREPINLPEDSISSRGAPQTSLHGQLTHSIRLSRHCISKELPVTDELINKTLADSCSAVCPDLCESEFSFAIPPNLVTPLSHTPNVTYPGVQLMKPIPSTVYPLPPIQMILSLMEDYWNAYTNCLLEDANLRELRSTSSETVEAIEVICRLLGSFHATLEFLSSLVQPRLEYEQLQFLELKQYVLSQRSEISSFLLEVVVKPLLSASEADRDKGLFDFSDCQEKLENLSRIMQQFSDAELSSERFCIKGDYGLIIICGLLERNLCRNEFTTLFMQNLRSKLDEFPISWRTHADTQALLSDSEEIDDEDDYDPLTMIAKAFITDQQKSTNNAILELSPSSGECMITNLSCTNRTNYIPNIEEMLVPRLRNAFKIGDSTIFITKEGFRTPDDEFEQEDRQEDRPNLNFHVHVVREGIEIARFPIPPNATMTELELEKFGVKHFTGRFYIEFDMCKFYQGKSTTFILIDFEPCLRDPPQPPNFHTSMLHDHIVQDRHYQPFTIEITDRFLSILCNVSTHREKEEEDLEQEETEQEETEQEETEQEETEQEETEQDEHTFTPSQLVLINFDANTGLERGNSINCFEQFDRVAQLLGDPEIYRDHAKSHTKLTWTNDKRKLFYSQWRYQEQANQNPGLLIICLDMSPDLSAVQNAIHGIFHPYTLLDGEQLFATIPRFSFIHLNKRGYLMMDLYRKCHRTIFGYKTKIQHTARAFFTVHANKIHWVTVNRLLFHTLPKQIGEQLTHTGYRTSHPSLLHQRRVFSVDKVVFEIHKISYKAN